MLRTDAGFQAVEFVKVEPLERRPIRILSYCVLPNHQTE